MYSIVTHIATFFYVRYSGQMNASKPHIAVVVPIYNENSSVVHSVIDDVVSFDPDYIFVIDDGSTIPFVYQGKSDKVEVLRHCINRGKGAALKTGVAYAKMKHADMCITLDGDGQHKVSDMRKFVDGIEHGHDVVLGYRSYMGGVMPLHKAFANMIGNITTYMVCGMWVRDSQCGFRAYNAQALSCINTRTDGYEYESEVVKEIHVHQLRVLEVPVETCYSAYASTKHVRQSFVRGVKTFFSILLFHRSS